MMTEYQLQWRLTLATVRSFSMSEGSARRLGRGLLRIRVAVAMPWLSLAPVGGVQLFIS